MLTLAGRREGASAPIESGIAPYFTGPRWLNGRELLQREVRAPRTLDRPRSTPLHVRGTPWSDLTRMGDTQFTNADVDDVLVTSDGLVGACARLDAGTHDLKHPLVSPVYGDFSGFPPTILVSGPRDLLLSDTVRVHRKLCQAGLEAQLHVFEGLSHAKYLRLFQAPESRNAFGEVSSFFDDHLGK